MSEMELYKLWFSQDLEDPDLTKELQEIAGDEEAIKGSASIKLWPSAPPDCGVCWAPAPTG